MARAKHIPVDLTRDIIGRLSDPKSLCRFKSISKSLSSMIAEIKSVDLVIVSKSTVYTANLDSPSSLKVLLLPAEILDNSTLTIDGSYNGFILFTTKFKIALWNKFSGDYQVIAREPHPSPPSSDADACLISGFGYDPVNNEYKLVEIICFYDGVDCPSGCIIRIYSSRNRTWRRPQRRISPFPYIYSDYYNTKQTVLVGNALHWVACRASNCRTPPFVIAFDLTTEKFHKIKLPEKSKATVVGAFKGCLTVTHPKDEVVDIWVMKEYRVKASWTHQFRISILKKLYGGCDPYACLRPLAASWRNGNKIFFQSGDGLLCYDLENNKLDFVDNSFQQLGNVYTIALCSWPTS